MHLDENDFSMDSKRFSRTSQLLGSSINSVKDLISSLKHLKEEEVEDHLSQNRLIVHSRHDTAQLNKSMETLKGQISLINMQHKREESQVSLDEVNKYVGYQSKTLTVTLQTTSGWLKKLVQEVAVFQKTIFPLRWYVFRRL